MIGTLYRELHYQIAKRNPLIANDEKQFKKAIKNAMSIKRGVGMQILGFLPFGLIMASTFIFTSEKIVLASLMVSLSLLPFIFAMYVTAIQTSYILSVGIFEPLKYLPVRLGSKYLSGLLLLEISPALATVLPSVFVLMAKYPYSGLLGVFWVFMGLFLGHTLGLIAVNFFSLKIQHRAGKGQSIRNIARIVLFFLFIGMFMVMNYLQYYIRDHSEEVARIVGKYFIAYPFSVASIFDPLRSLVLLGTYFSVFGFLYYLTLRSVWGKILEPAVVSEKHIVSKFKAKTTNKIFAVVFKDFKVFLRKPAMLVAFLFPIYILFPTLISSFREGHLSLLEVLPLLFMIGLFSVPGADAVLKVEGKALDFLRTLPLEKREFVIGKVLSMATVPILLGIALVGLGSYYGYKAVVLFPYAILLPLIASFTTMLYFFHYSGEEIGIPDLKWIHVIFMFILVGAIFAIIAIPVILSLENIFISQFIGFIILLVLVFLIRGSSR